MNKCPVCSSTQKTGEICQVCGFDNSRNYEEYKTLAPIPEGKIRSISALRIEWKNKVKYDHIKNLKIGLRTHYYNLDEDKLSHDHSEDIVLVEGAQLVENQYVWSDVNFVRVEDMDLLTIELFVWDNANKQRKHRLVIDNPGGSGFWKAGIKLINSNEYEAILAVGTQGSYEESDRFSLLV